MIDLRARFYYGGKIYFVEWWESDHFYRYFCPASGWVTYRWAELKYTTMLEF